MEVNDKAPQFSLLDQDGEKVSLKDLKGQSVVLYFYPRADTPGCTTEACDFRDEYSKIKKKAVILGVSPDVPEDQKSFAKKFSLPFQLLADDEKEVAKAYGVWKEKSMYGKKFMGIERSTFIIGPDGKIKKIFPKVKVKGHAEAVLEALESESEKPATKK